MVGAPVEGALAAVIQEYQEVPIERLSDLGVEAYALDALDGEYAFYFWFSPDLSAAIDVKNKSVTFLVLSGRNALRA